MGGGLWVGTLHKTETHSLHAREQSHHGPTCELRLIVSNFTSKADSLLRVKIFSPRLSLFIPQEQRIKIHVLISAGHVRVDRASDTNFDRLGQLPNLVLVAHFCVDLILILQEWVLFFEFQRLAVLFPAILDSREMV